MLDRAKPGFKTALGQLYRCDCKEFLVSQPGESVDVVFADPPFNLGKSYPSGVTDCLSAEDYISWCESWLTECVRVLRPGGSLFVWNLPKWNTYLASFLNRHLTFRNWISVDMKCSLPIRGRLYPSHYSLLYYCKGLKPNCFHPDRLPMQICPHCVGDLRDYGGYKKKMNPKGVNISDVWTDITPVRHAKHKRRGTANELSIKLLDRAIEMSSDPGDLILDPFGGSGTTYAVAELKGRRWLGCEIGSLDDAISRLEQISSDEANLARVRESLNCLFVEENRERREAKGLWVDTSER